MHQSTTPSLSLTIWPRWVSTQFVTVPIVQTLLPVTFGYSLSSKAVVMKQLSRWKRLWRRSLTRSHKWTSMGPSRKKPGNLFNERRLYIYIYIYIMEVRNSFKNVFHSSYLASKDQNSNACLIITISFTYLKSALIKWDCLYLFIYFFVLFVFCCCFFSWGLRFVSRF